MNDDFDSKQKAIAIAPKMTSLMSFCGSSFIIYSVLTNKKEIKMTHSRLLLGMSCCDLITSATFFLTTWPIPKDTPNVYGASGTLGTCIAQGWFSQFSIAVVMYNASLSIYYLLRIRYQWTSERIRKIEWRIHAFPLLFGIITSTAGVLLDLYNNDSWECWIAPLPQDCKESWKNNGETNCVRGDNASSYRWILYYAPLWIAIVCVTVAMFLVYRSVLQTERKSDRYAMGHEGRRKHSAQVANQGYWYCGAFYATWMFPTITRLVQLIFSRTPFPLILVTAMFVPIQGFFNAIVYIHPRWKSVRTRRYSSALIFSSPFRKVSSSSTPPAQAKAQSHLPSSTSTDRNPQHDSVTVNYSATGTQEAIGVDQDHGTGEDVETENEVSSQHQTEVEESKEKDFGEDPKSNKP